MLAVAISTVFRSAMNGVSAKQDVAEEPIPLAIHIPALPARGGTDLVARLFTPLGWQVTANQLPLDQAFPDWGDSAYVDLRLTASTITLAAALKMSCCRCSTTPSTTGSAQTKLTSCCGPATAGWAATPSAS